MKILDGYKTIIGAIITAVAAGLTYAGYADLGAAFNKFGFAMLTLGVAGKIEKAGQ